MQQCSCLSGENEAAWKGQFRHVRNYFPVKKNILYIVYIVYVPKNVKELSYIKHHQSCHSKCCYATENIENITESTRNHIQGLVQLYHSNCAHYQFFSPSKPK